MKRKKVWRWLFCVIVLISPIWVWAAPLSQEGTATPIPTEHPVALTLNTIATEPGDVILYAPFSLVYSIHNATSSLIDDIVVTYRDVDDDGILVALKGTKTDTLPALGPYLAVRVSKELRYLTDKPGLRKIELMFTYTYRYGAQSIARAQTETFLLRVIAPPPTPTATWTPTPTPTHTPTPTLTPTPTETPEPMIDLQATLVAELAATVAAIPSPRPPVEPIATPEGQGEEASGGSGPLPAPTRDTLIVEFADVPLSVQPGKAFTMTLILRNTGDDPATALVARWITEESTIVPIGRGTQWYLHNISIPAGQLYKASGQFYVKRDAALGQIEVSVEYFDLGVNRAVKGAVYVPLADEPGQAPRPLGTPAPTAVPTPTPTATEPLWLRILRAIFGGGTP